MWSEIKELYTIYIFSKLGLYLITKTKSHTKTKKKKSEILDSAKPELEKNKRHEVLWLI